MKNFMKFVCAALAAVMFSFMQNPAAEAKTRLNMSSWFPSAHPIMTEGLGPWSEKFEEVTEGLIKVRILKKTVGNPLNQYDVVSTGQVDIGYTNQSYTPERFKLHLFNELPGSVPTVEAASVALWRTYSKFYPGFEEYKDVKLLCLFSMGPADIFYSDKFNVTGMQGNAGIKIRAGGPSLTRVVEALGMTPIQASFGKVVEMVSSGVVDGTTNDPAAFMSVGFDRYLKKRLIYEGSFSGGAFFLVMNKDTWNEISPKDQAAIEAISGEALARQLGQIWDRSIEKALADMEKSGVQTTHITGKFKEDIEKIFAKWEAEYISSVADGGADGRDVLTYYRDQLKLLNAK